MESLPLDTRDFGVVACLMGRNRISGGKRRWPMDKRKGLMEEGCGRPHLDLRRGIRSSPTEMRKGYEGIIRFQYTMHSLCDCDAGSAATPTENDELHAVLWRRSTHLLLIPHLKAVSFQLSRATG
ncbi:hypothetical protein EVAR_10137_1 [Eumeta japonica]|uniref:Uncharacterized protein n=1 Tax=Eumeta variegata TaxID=151549 RepID=A0A4C1UDL0_EUMVA|nr:hypothetical protein EVAR_10137_1 [Eumeta japonica]